MKLHEEFKEYENLWGTDTFLEEVAEPDPVDKVLLDTPDIELEYCGFSNKYTKDHFDPGSWRGHYQTSGSDYYGDFTYKVDPVTMFETIRDDIIPEYASKYPTNELLCEYIRLDKLFQEAPTETAEELGETCDLFLAQNLENFVDLFVDELTKYFSEDAHDWARDSLEPDDGYWD